MSLRPRAAIHAALPDIAKEVVAGAENFIRTAGTVSKVMDRTLLGIAATGVAAAVATMGFINHQGYAPRPLTMPGEALDPDVASAISSGNLFSPRVPVTRGSGDGYSMMDRPLNTPAVYMKQANSYQVRGQIPSMNGALALNNFVGSMGSPTGGSIRINDTRSPITSAYTDRVLGNY